MTNIIVRKVVARMPCVTYNINNNHLNVGIINYSLFYPKIRGVYRLYMRLIPFRLSCVNFIVKGGIL